MVIEESKNINFIKVHELVGSFQTYEIALHGTKKP